MSGRTRTAVLTFAGILAFVVAGCSTGDNDAAISGSASGADQGPILVTFGPVDGKSGPQAAYNGVLRVDGNCVYVEDPDGTETGLRFPDGTRLSPDHTTVIFPDRTAYSVNERSDFGGGGSEPDGTIPEQCRSFNTYFDIYFW